MTFDAELANLASEVAEHLGRVVTVTPYTIGTATNISTGARVRTAGTPVQVRATRSIIATAPIRGTQSGQAERNVAVEVMFGVSIAELGFTPNRLTEITDNGFVYDVVDVEIQMHGTWAECRCKSKGRPQA
jgi:hypothetical protein